MKQSHVLSFSSFDSSGIQVYVILNCFWCKQAILLSHSQYVVKKVKHFVFNAYCINCRKTYCKVLITCYQESQSHLNLSIYKSSCHTKGFTWRGFNWIRAICCKNTYCSDNLLCCLNKISPFYTYRNNNVYIIFELQCPIELLFFVFQLYEIDDNPKRRDFLDELFSMMQKRGKFIFTK